MILDGKALSERILDTLRDEIAGEGYTPGLGVILVGEDSASELYVSVKERACRRVGIRSVVKRFPKYVTQDEVIGQIESFNGDEGISGILVQLPLPSHIDKVSVINSILREKDVDGFTIYNTGCIELGMEPYCYPCTPMGIISLMREYGIAISGRHAVVVGRSDIVGKPLSRMLLNLDATVTQCHSKTADLASYTRQADILISAVGIPKLITSDMVKPNSVVIDVGISRLDGKLAGDVDFASVADKVSYITPVPNGIGPMTIASLMQNTLKLYKLNSIL